MCWCEQDSYAHVWRLTYDSQRRVSGLIDLAGQTIAYGYNDAQHLLTSVAILRRRLRYAHMYMGNEYGWRSGRPRLLTGILQQEAIVMPMIDPVRC